MYQRNHAECNLSWDWRWSFYMSSHTALMSLWWTESTELQNERDKWDTQLNPFLYSLLLTVTFVNVNFLALSWNPYLLKKFKFFLSKCRICDSWWITISGLHSGIIVPPSWIVKLPRRGSFKSSLRKSPKKKTSSKKKSKEKVSWYLRF